jgi:hypothetical protein
MFDVLFSALLLWALALVDNSAGFNKYNRLTKRTQTPQTETKIFKKSLPLPLTARNP